MLMGQGNDARWLSVFHGGEDQITYINRMVFSQCFLWPPATKEYIHIGSTHQLHTAEYKQKKEDQSYLQGTEIPHILPQRIPYY